MSLTESLRSALRIKTASFDSEIAALVEACKVDLSLAGVDAYNEDDPLCKQAVTFYAKANFGFNGDDCDKYQARYEQLKAALAHSSKYGGGGG